MGVGDLVRSPMMMIWRGDEKSDGSAITNQKRKVAGREEDQGKKEGRRRKWRN